MVNQERGKVEGVLIHRTAAELGVARDALAGGTGEFGSREKFGKGSVCLLLKIVFDQAKKRRVVVGAPWKGASSLWVRNPRNSFRFGW